MSRNYYTEIHLHITWHTKESAPILTPEYQTTVFRSIRDRCSKTPQVIFREIGGIETHLHLAVSVPPTLLISEWIGQLKGGSSFDLNQQVGSKVLEWQAGYGVVSFGTKNMEWVIRYIRNQKEHHAQKTTLSRLERTRVLDSDELP